MHLESFVRAEDAKVPELDGAADTASDCFRDVAAEMSRDDPGAVFAGCGYSTCACNVWCGVWCGVVCGVWCVVCCVWCVVCGRK